jgi:hypothetical protein
MDRRLVEHRADPGLMRSEKSARPRHDGERSVASFLVQARFAILLYYHVVEAPDVGPVIREGNHLGACGGRLPIPSATANCKR